MSSRELGCIASSKDHRVTGSVNAWSRVQEQLVAVISWIVVKVRTSSRSMMVEE